MSFDRRDHRERRVTFATVGIVAAAVLLAHAQSGRAARARLNRILWAS